MHGGSSWSDHGEQCAAGGDARPSWELPSISGFCLRRRVGIISSNTFYTSVVLFLRKQKQTNIGVVIHTLCYSLFFRLAIYDKHFQCFTLEPF